MGENGCEENKVKTVILKRKDEIFGGNLSRLIVARIENIGVMKCKISRIPILTLAPLYTGPVNIKAFIATLEKISHGTRHTALAAADIQNIHLGS